MEKELYDAYRAFEAKHGREPLILKTDQAHYYAIEQFCSVDFDTGLDMCYLSAQVVVDGIDGWHFE